MKFQVDRLEEIVGWLLGWSGFVQVVRPPELQSLVNDRLRSALTLYDWGYRYTSLNTLSCHKGRITRENQGTQEGTAHGDA
jgi:hypothetical protein